MTATNVVNTADPDSPDHLATKERALANCKACSNIQPNNCEAGLAPRFYSSEKDDFQ